MGKTLTRDTRAMHNRLLFSIVLTLIFTAAVSGQYVVPDLTLSELDGPAHDPGGGSVYANALVSSGKNLADLEAMLADPGNSSDGDDVSDLIEFLTGADPDNPSVNAEDHIENFNLALALAGDLDLSSGDYSDLDNELDQVFEPDITLPPYLPYLSPTLETQFSKELRELAADLDYDPVRIYEWVYANIEYEDYALSRKGALATYRTRRGNEWDQCSLLITLLRISGVPARYVFGGRNYRLFAVNNDTNDIDKDFVAAQAWVSASRYGGGDSTSLDAPQRAWITLVPWRKTTEVISQGLDLFELDTDGTTLKIPDGLDIRTGRFALHWKFEDIPNVADGDDVYDSAGFHRGIKSGSGNLTYQTSMINGIDVEAADFDGNILLTAPNSVDIDKSAQRQYSISFWFKADNPPVRSRLSLKTGIQFKVLTLT